MRLSRSQWLHSASANRALRHLRSLCLLMAGTKGYSAKERHLAARLARGMTALTQHAIVSAGEIEAARGRFAALEAEVIKRLEPVALPCRPDRG